MPELALVDERPALGGLVGRDLLRIDDLSADELLALLDLADRLKALQHERIPHPMLPGRSLALSSSSMRRAACCSALRRERPSPRSTSPSAATVHSTSKVCACAWPRVAAMR